MYLESIFLELLACLHIDSYEKLNFIDGYKINLKIFKIKNLK